MKPVSYLIEQWPATVQAAAAVAIVVLTYRLSRATDTYARLTSQALDLSKQQFERELLPNWHISFVKGAPTGSAELTLRNLSKASARVTHLLIRVQAESESRRFQLDLGMPGGHAETENITQMIEETIKPCMIEDEWNGILEIAVVFILAGSTEPRPSDRFQFRVEVRKGKFFGAKTKPPYIAGVFREGDHQ